MLISPGIQDWITAARVYRRFVSRPGADHIASRTSLAHLTAVLRTFDCKRVLELGAGIGTITYLLLQKQREVIALEHNSFCQHQLELNIPTNLRSQLRLVSDGAEIDGVFDLVIIDGKIPPTTHRFLTPGTICFAEGSRRHTIARFQNRAQSAGLRFAMEKQRPLIPLRVRMRGLSVKVFRKKTCRIGVVESSAVDAV
jgi:tRNA G37 N-methylase Trm5